MMLGENHIKALRELYARLHEHEINWALTGSTSFVLQGIPLQAHDIDVQTDRAGAYAIEQLFSKDSIRPVAFSGTKAIRSHFGALLLQGIQVELMGDIQKRLPDGRWEEIVDIRPYKRWIELDDVKIPVLALEYEQRAYKQLGRKEKAALLADFIRQTRNI